MRVSTIFASGTVLMTWPLTKISPEVGSDPDYPDITPRDAAAMREWAARSGTAA